MINKEQMTNTESLLAALENQTATLLAVLEIQREILQAVREIQIGDEIIGQANDRYRQKMAVVNGGVL